MSVIQKVKRRLEERQRAKAYTCPYCRSNLRLGEPLVRCVSCHTFQHPLCWRENSKCSVFGCNSEDCAFAAIGPLRFLLPTLAVLLPSVKILLSHDPSAFVSLLIFGLAYLYYATYKNPLLNVFTEVIDSFNDNREYVLFKSYLFFAFWLVSLVAMFIR